MTIECMKLDLECLQNQLKKVTREIVKSEDDLKCLSKEKQVLLERITKLVQDIREVSK